MGMGRESTQVETPARGFCLNKRNHNDHTENLTLTCKSRSRVNESMIKSIEAYTEDNDFQQNFILRRGKNSNQSH